MVDAILKPEDWTNEDRKRARRIWEQYQQEHDLTDRKGDTAGIDPRSGEVWLGSSIIDISNQRRTVGAVGALLFERVGCPAHTAKKDAVRTNPDATGDCRYCHRRHMDHRAADRLRDIRHRRPYRL